MCCFGVINFHYYLKNRNNRTYGQTDSYGNWAEDQQIVKISTFTKSHKMQYILKVVFELEQWKVLIEKP